MTFPRWPGVAISLVLVFSGLAVGDPALMPKDTNIPNPASPSPNARDFFQLAEALLTGPIDNALDHPTAPPPGITAAQLADPANEYHLFTLADKDQIVSENRAAFDKLEQGLNYPYLAAQARSIADEVEPYPQDRKLARALDLAGQTSEAHGNWGAAMTYYLDGMEEGADLSHGARLLGMLVSTACETINRRSAYDVINHLDLAQSKSSLSRLEAIDVQRATPSENLTEEKWFTQGALLSIFNSPSWQSNLESLGGNQVSIVGESPRAAYDAYSTYMDKLIAFTSLPWPVQASTQSPPVPTDPVNSILLPMSSIAIFRSYVGTTLDRLLEIELALHAVYLQNGTYPTSLASLAPDYLSALPTDPFTDGLAFKYRAYGTKYVLYSVGPDGVDDGSSPINNPSNAFSPYNVASQSEKGDIVAGINQ